MNENLDTPKYIEVKNKIKNKIICGELSGKLPGERTLAESFGYSYMTIRNAINELVSEGFLYKMERKGTFVSQLHKTVNKTGNIGFFLPEMIVGGIYGPYYSMVFHWLEKECRKNDFNLIYFSTLDKVGPKQLKKKVDGLVVSYFPDLKKSISDFSRYLPITCIDNMFESASVPSVLFDNVGGTYSSVSFLVDKGLTRIGYIAGLPDSDICRDRLKGYVDAVDDFGLDKEPYLIYYGDYSFDSGLKGGIKLLSQKNPPKGIICANDNMAYGVIRAAIERGLKIPEDLSIIGFDDVETSAKMNPPLTTIHAPLQILCKLSVSNLMNMMNNKILENTKKVIPTWLVVRESTI